MAVTSHVYPNWIKVLAQKPTNSPDMDGDTFAAGLCTTASATWAATQWAYVFASDIVTAYTEVTTGGGYTSGYANRQAVAAPTFALGSANNIYKWTCTSPISFGATTTITAATMFIYDKTANAAAADTSSWVPWSTDFGGNVISTAGAFTYTLDATNGLAFWTAS